VTRKLTEFSSTILEKLTVPQTAMKFPAFYGAQRFITAFTRARYLFLSRERSVQFISPIPLPVDPVSYYPSIYA